MVFLALTWVSRSLIWTIYLLASRLEILLGLHGLMPPKGVQAIWWMACPSNGRFLAWLPYGITMEGFSFIQTTSKAASYLLQSSSRQDRTINCELHTLYISTLPHLTPVLP